MEGRVARMAATKPVPIPSQQQDHILSYHQFPDLFRRSYPARQQGNLLFPFQDAPGKHYHKSEGTYQQSQGTQGHKNGQVSIGDRVEFSQSGGRQVHVPSKVAHARSSSELIVAVSLSPVYEEYMGSTAFRKLLQEIVLGYYHIALEHRWGQSPDQEQIHFTPIGIHVVQGIPHCQSQSPFDHSFVGNGRNESAGQFLIQGESQG